MTKPSSLPNKFERLSREDLIASLLELEDELVKLRPKPAKFKLGQVIVRPAGSGVPSQYFAILSVENRAGKWYYGYSKQPGSVGQFHVLPEDKCRVLNPTEIDGSPASAEQVAAMETSTQTVVAPAIHYVTPEELHDSHGY